MEENIKFVVVHINRTTYRFDISRSTDGGMIKWPGLPSRTKIPARFMKKHGTENASVNASKNSY